MKKILLKVGDKICITGYRKDNYARIVEIDTIKPGGLMVCKCLVRSSAANPVYRSYYKKHIDGVLPIKVN